MIFVQFAMSVSCYFQASRFSGDDSALIHIWVYRAEPEMQNAKCKMQNRRAEERGNANG